jgi:hypothetical protein
MTVYKNIAVSASEPFSDHLDSFATAFDAQIEASRVRDCASRITSETHVTDFLTCFEGKLQTSTNAETVKQIGLVMGIALDVVNRGSSSASCTAPFVRQLTTVLLDRVQASEPSKVYLLLEAFPKMVKAAVVTHALVSGDTLVRASLEKVWTEASVEKLPKWDRLLCYMFESCSASVTREDSWPLDGEMKSLSVPMVVYQALFDQLPNLYQQFLSKGCYEGLPT